MVKTIHPELATLESRATRMATMIDEFKGEDVAVLDLRGLTDFADAFVVATARSTTHMQSIVANLETRLRDEGLRPLNPIEHPAMHSDARWVILDYADVVVHVFTKEARAFYNLENLWGDATPLEWARFSA